MSSDARLINSEHIKVLCVDDEPNVLEGLSLHIRRSYQVFTATSGAEALDTLRREPAIAIVVSDMRMPGMNGAALLSQARAVAPDTVRMLLTGQADLESAIAAVNDGQIFRFLTKPCAPPALLKAVGAAATQHRLITSERVLLEQTLHGSIKALADVLALTSPASFGRASRIKQHVSAIAEKLELTERWQVEVSAMLSQLGSIVLPVETAEKAYYGRPLDPDEQKLAERVPAVTEQLLGNIPRLEVVRGILASYTKPRLATAAGQQDPVKALIARGAHILRAAVDFDALEAQGYTASVALGTMRGRASQYDIAVLNTLQELYGVTKALDEVRDLPISTLQVGMVFAEDVKLTTGALLAARGYEVTAGFVERARNFRHAIATDKVRVVVPRFDTLDKAAS
jgi:CheY-like chemotaxis protein